MDKDKHVDESWKDSVAQEKETGAGDGKQAEGLPPIEINFLNYITSLGFQALIFMGEIPHPLTNESEKNLPQAKLIIDTLMMLQEKTKGNLTEQEANLLEASLYELQLKFVEATQKEGPVIGPDGGKIE